MSHRPARRRGFTLVELLVVIGIIALLISILLPALYRAREQGNKIKCASNMKQVMIALIMYTNDNRGRFPASGRKDLPKPEDWVHWQTPETTARNLNTSAIAPYLSKPVNRDVLICPSDDVETRISTSVYPFSYAMNWHLANNFSVGQIDPAERDLFVAGLSMTRVRNASDKIVFVEEDFRTLNDATWAPMGCRPSNNGFDWLASRHEKLKAKPDGVTVTASPWRISDPSDPRLAARANAAFADGHVEYVNRLEAHNRANLVYGE